jgi:HAD superfamily hydrolase (TIGR01459 family)
MRTRIAALAPLYDLFLVDQFGVLHDGRQPYPGAVEALVRLRREGRRVVILSNSGKRSAGNEARMASLGFDRAGWDLFLSSGEVAWRLLAERPAEERPKRCLVLSRDADTSPIDGLGIAATDRDEDADLLLIAGSEAPERSLGDYRALLTGPAERQVPALCVNPDMTMLVAGGTAFGAGRIARLYEELGGAVTFIGKPYPAMYHMALDLVGGRPDMAVGIGDSVEHDVVGAKSVGAAAAFVVGGIHAGEDDLDRLYERYGARPDHVLERFAW